MKNWWEKQNVTYRNPIGISFSEMQLLYKISLSYNRKGGLWSSDVRGVLKQTRPTRGGRAEPGSEGLGREAVEKGVRERPPFQPWPSSILVATIKTTFFFNFRSWHSLTDRK